MASQELADQVLGSEFALVVGDALELVGFHLEAVHLAHHQLEGLQLVLQLLVSHLLLLWLDLLGFLFLFWCVQDVAQDLFCFLCGLFLVVVAQNLPFDVGPRGSLHEFQQVEEVSVLIDVSQQASLHSFRWIFAQILEILLDDLDKVVDLVLDLFLVGPGKLSVLGVDYQDEVFGVVLANNVVVHSSGEGFGLAYQHDHQGLIVSILVWLLKRLLVHHYNFLGLRPVAVLDLDVGTVVSRIEEKLVLLSGREIVGKNCVLPQLRVLI